MSSEKMKVIAPTIVRTGVALVILWFGVQQLIDTNAWVGLIPSWATSLSGFEASTLVIINGSMEIVIGTLLLLGFFTTIIGLLSALHLLLITYVVGYNGVGVRDFGLAMGAISTFLYGADSFSLDAYFANRKTKQAKIV
ncbi:MAG: DoxX family membrane protein [Minisyncoccia bacterium]